MYEAKLRNTTYIQVIKLLKAARSLSETLPEYPEMNVAIIEINEALSNMKDRLTAIAKTSDKNLLIRVHQIDSIEEV